MSIYDASSGCRQSNEDKPHVLIVGDPLKGFKVVGPFPTWSAASLAGEDYEPNVSVTLLKKPRRD